MSFGLLEYQAIDHFRGSSYCNGGPFVERRTQWQTTCLPADTVFISDMNIPGAGPSSRLAFVGGLLALRFSPARLSIWASRNPVKIQRPMGTVWNIEVVDSRHGPSEARQAISQAYAELERIEAMMSEWKPESPISQVDAAAASMRSRFRLNCAKSCERSIRYSEDTEGTFDITWRGMGNIWHFDDSFVVPSEAEVAQARKNIDYRTIHIKGTASTYRRARTSVWVESPKDMG